MQVRGYLNHNRLASRSSTIRTVVFLAVGVTLVVCSILFRSSNQPTLEAVTLNLGLISIAVVLLDQLWRICGGNPMDRQIASLSNQINRLSQSVDVIESSKNIGLTAVYDRQGNFGKQSDWEELIAGAVNSVDLMGRTLFGWTRSNKITNIITEKIQRDNVVFRWLIMGKQNKYLPMLTEEDIDISCILEKKLEAIQEFLMSIRNSLPEDCRGRFEVRVFSHVPLYFSMIRIDDRYYVTQYLFSSGTDNSPMYCVRGLDAVWSQAYSQEFDTIWKMSQDFFAVSAGRQAPT